MIMYVLKTEKIDINNNNMIIMTIIIAPVLL